LETLEGGRSGMKAQSLKQFEIAAVEFDRTSR